MSGIDRRRFVRVNFPCLLNIADPHEHSISSYTENISEGGVKISIEEKLETGMTVGLELRIGDQEVVCKGEISWVVRKESPYHKGFFFYDTGIEFRDIQDQDRVMIKELVDKIISGGQQA